MDAPHRGSVIFTILTTVLLAACGGGPAASGGRGSGATSGGGTTDAPVGGTTTTAPGSAAAVDACGLLTSADIRAVTGNETESSTARPMYGIFPSGCEWTLIDSEAVVLPSIGLGVMATGGKAYYDAYFAPFIEENDYVPIQGLGDEALEDVAGAVLVLSGDTFFNLQYLGGGFGNDDTAVSTDLAEKVVANLGP